MNVKDKATCLLNTYPEKIQYFKEEHVSQCILIPFDKPNIGEIVDVFIHPEIIDTRLVETKNGISNEGQKLTGYKLISQVKFNVKITYVSDDKLKNIFMVNYEILKSIFIVLPKFIDNKNISDMFKSSRIVVSPIIEHTNTRQLDCRTVDTTILIFLDAKIC